MATPSTALHASRVFSRCISLLQQPTAESATNRSGKCGIGRAKHRVWVCAGTPSGTAPGAMKAGDWILDTTNLLVYRYISSTTYVNMTATS